MISVLEYREMLGDQTSTDEQIKKRTEYLVALCKNVARCEIEMYVKDLKQKKKEDRSCSNNRAT
jgi:hypothetical protein